MALSLLGSGYPEASKILTILTSYSILLGKRGFYIYQCTHWMDGALTTASYCTATVFLYFVLGVRDSHFRGDGIAL